MDRGPLVREEIDAGAEFVREFDKYEPVKAAFWLKAADDDFRYHYIASDKIDDANKMAAYGEVLRLADKIQSPFLDPFRVKLLNANEQLVKAALEINEGFAIRVPTRLGGMSFGGVSVDDVCIYPSPLPA